MTHATVFDFIRQQLSAPLEPVVHPSRARLMATGWFLIICYPLFGVIWYFLQPQIFDGPWLRLGLASTGIPLTLSVVNRHPTSKLTGRVASVVFWTGLPFAFSWMYVCNGGNFEWFACVCGMVLIYYHLTDWRIATVGMFTGIAAAFLLHFLARTWLPVTPEPPYGPHAALFGFCWAAAITVGASSANLRREGIRKTRETMNIIAHELRTPIAATDLLAKALQEKANLLSGSPMSEADLANDLEEIGKRLSGCVTTMDRRINSLLVNSSQPDQSVQLEKSKFSIGSMLRHVLENFPYPYRASKAFVVLDLREDFVCWASERLLSHVVNNLISNSFMALRAKDQQLVSGDLTITASVDHVSKTGIIRVTDKGIGINGAVLEQIFEPFVTSNPAMGLGLGLAFCREAVKASGGNISVESSTGFGTCITLSLPLARA